MLVTCFNFPLADTLRHAFALDPDIRIGTFHQIGFGLEGMPELERPAVADAAIDAVGGAIGDLEDRGHGAQSILVATFTTAVRDLLRRSYAFVAWEDREPMAIVCENVHRVKGLEFDHVILVLHDDTVSDELLYVGLSSAVISATVIGPGDRLAVMDNRVDRVRPQASSDSS